MGRKRRFPTPESLAEAWERDKHHCDTKTAVKTEFSQRTAAFITSEVLSPVTYTIEGFCVRNNIARGVFYKDYVDNPKYRDIVNRMKEECEQNVRERFEKGEIPSQLAALWMSKFGYSTKTDTNVTGAVPVVISGGDSLED